MIKKGIGLLLLSSSMAYGQLMDEVITLKDGRELRGEIIEQSFTRGTYTVRLNEGGIVDISKKQVSRITRVESQRQPEPVVQAEVNENTDFNQLPATSAGLDVKLVEDSRSQYPKHVFRVGTAARSIVDSDGDGVGYFGLNAAYQYNVTSGFGIYTAFYNGDLQAVTIDGETTTVSGDVPSIEGVQLALNFANKFTRGFQYYGGLGMFKDRITALDDTYFDASGFSIHGGLGYSWEPLELMYRLSLDKSSDYDDAFGVSANFQLGLAF